MAYDLILAGTSPAALAALPLAAEAAEITGDDARAVVALNGSEEALYPFVLALLSHASRHGLRVDDPQIGRPITSIAELEWIAPPNPSGKTLKTLLKRWTASVLAPHGFTHDGKGLVQRTVDGLIQGFEFLPPRHGRFQVQLFWTLRPDGDDSRVSSFASTLRFATLCDQPGLDFTASPLATGFAAAARVAERDGLPFLDRHAGLGPLLAGVERGELSEAQAFGLDPGWRCFHRAQCLAYVGEHDRAVEAFQTVIDLHTGEYAWMLERRDDAQRQIDALTA